jgi:peptidoglycan/LPS O-acetylase OafA/YrhL
MLKWYRPESDQYLHLDLLRFLASAAVVVFHYRALMDWSQPPRVQAALDTLRFAVDLFFVISGIVMADLYGGRIGSGGAYGTFLRRRIARLLPLHYATLGFCILLGVLAGAMGFKLSEPEAFDAACILPNLLMLQAFNTCDHLSFNGPSWSISAEMGLYLALPLLLALSRRRTLTLALAVGSALSLFVLYGRAWTDWTYHFGVVRALPSFLLGLTLARSDGLLAKLPAPRFLLIPVFAGFVAASLLPVHELARLVLVYLIVALALAADRRGDVHGLVRGLAPLGRLTYSLYMLHMPVALVLISGAAKHVLGLTGAAMNGWVIATGVLVLPVVAVLSSPCSKPRCGG